MCLFSFCAYDRSHMKSVVLPPSLKTLLPPEIHELCTGAFYKKNERLFLTGKIPQSMFYVVAGEVTLERTGLQGEPVVLQRTRLGFVSEASLKVAKYHCDALAITDLIGGQTQLMFATMPTILPYVKSDKLRGLAVTGATRDPSMPDLPSISETLSGFDVKNWIGLFAPAGTPPAIVKKLNLEVGKIMQQPAVQKKLESEGAKYYAMSPEAFGSFQKKESARWGKIIKSAGIKPE